MKITSLHIQHIGLISDETIQLNKPLIVFYGEVRQGKSTILNAVRWVLGGKFPSDIIKHGAQDGLIEMSFDGGSISRSFYKSKSGETKARDVVFIQDGKPVVKPSEKLKAFLNPFLLDQDHLRNMSEPERKAFFIDLLGVDTAALDTEATTLAQTAAKLRIKIDSYGDIDLTEVKSVDVASLRAMKAKMESEHDAQLSIYHSKCDEIRKEEDRKNDKIRDEYQMACADVAKKNAAINNLASMLDRNAEKIDDLDAAIADWKLKIKTALETRRTLIEFADSHPRQYPLPNPPHPEPPAAPQYPNRPNPIDTSELDCQISEAAANEVRRSQYLANVERDNKRKADSQVLWCAEKRQREIKLEKAAKLKSISDNCKIQGLAFDESGNFTFEGTQAGMLSTSQIMRLSSALSALYPDGFGIELLDRGESLGRAIFKYVEHAKEHNSTVLATVVGERPAQSIAEVGVFVVKDGIIIKD